MIKQELRKKMIALRNALSAEQRKEAAEACAYRLAQRAVFDSAQTIFCYVAFGGELSLEPIAMMARAAGKNIAFPRVLDEEKMEFVLGGAFQVGYRGIPEPQDGEVVIPTSKDLILLPGLAFSPDGSRLGYGKGYYDRYMADLKSRPAYWGVCYSEQLLPALPTEKWDRPVDAILTPEGIIRCGR